MCRTSIINISEAVEPCASESIETAVVNDGTFDSKSDALPTELCVHDGTILKSNEFEISYSQMNLIEHATEFRKGATYDWPLGAVGKIFDRSLVS